MQHIGSIQGGRLYMLNLSVSPAGFMVKSGYSRSGMFTNEKVKHDPYAP